MMDFSYVMLAEETQESTQLNQNWILLLQDAVKMTILGSGWLIYAYLCQLYVSHHKQAGSFLLELNQMQLLL